MKHQDNLSKHYESILQDGYDCVDRIVLNAYCLILLRPGGLRYWYRLLKGEDDTLDNNHLMRMAGRFSRRVESYAKKYDIPLISFKAGERKHEVAQKLIPKAKNFTGIFAIFKARSYALLWDVKRFSRGIDIRRKKNLSFCNHYYFHIIDKDWGHIMIKMSAHPPFSSQIILNGHEWVERKAIASKLNIHKQGNCFIDYQNGATLTRHADTLTQQGRLEQVADRWIYRCMWFALDYAQQKQSQVRYHYSIYQIEYSRNLLFKRGRFLDQVYQGIIDLSRSKLDIPRLKTIFGRKTRPYKHKKNRASRGSAPEVRIEKPDYNLTIFKIHFGKLTVKLYDKGERTLRAEVVVHNTKDLKCKRSISNFHQVVDKLKVIINDFLNNLQYLHVSMIDELNLNTLASPTRKGSNRLAGINISKPRTQDLLQAVLALSIQPGGYTSKQLAQQMNHIGWTQYTPRNAAYDLRKLRAKKLVEKQGARRYVNTPNGIQTIVTLLTLLCKQIPQTFAILKNIDSINDKELSLLEQLHFNIKKEVVALQAIYGIYSNAA